MSPNNNPRQRGKNFTESEEALLLELVRGQRHVLNFKKSGAMIWNRKKEAWKDLAHQFSMQTGEHRSWIALREKYRCMKCRKLKTTTVDKCKKLSIIASTSVVATELCKSSENNATNDESIPIKTELFEIIELEESCVQNNPANLAKPLIAKQSQEKINSETIPQKNQSFKNSMLGKRTLEEEKIVLLKLQQKFYEDENTRSIELHHMKLQSLELQKELLEIEVKMRNDALLPQIKVENDSS